MGPEGNILVNSPISTFQQGLTHSALRCHHKCEICFPEKFTPVVTKDDEYSWTVNVIKDDDKDSLKLRAMTLKGRGRGDQGCIWWC